MVEAAVDYHKLQKDILIGNEIRIQYCAATILVRPCYQMITVN